MLDRLVSQNHSEMREGIDLVYGRSFWSKLVSTIVIAPTLIAIGAHAQSALEPSLHKSYYVDPAVLNLAPLVPAPPAQNSKTTQDELKLLHQIEASRTPDEVAKAKADDAEEDIFIFRTVLGPSFKAEQLPAISALSAHIHGEEASSSGPLKSIFKRPRPYQWDKTLHPVCKTTDTPSSYPSGHTTSGYLLGLTLAELLPERKQEILDRIEDYAHNRLICGVHYPSDLAASQRAAYVIFGYMMATPRFNRDLEAARYEFHAHREWLSDKK